MASTNHPHGEGAPSPRDGEAIPRVEQPVLEYALDQALILKNGLEETTRSAVHATTARLSQIGSTASAHSLHTLELIRSHVSEVDELAFAKLKECLFVAADHPAATCGVVVAVGAIGLKRPRNFLFRHSRRLFVSEESLHSHAEATAKSLQQVVASLKHEGKKLEERALMAETDFLSGQTRLRQTGNQISGLISSLYKVEKQIRGLKDIVGELPRKDGSIFRSKIASLASNVKKEKKVLEKAVGKISGYGIPV